MTAPYRYFLTILIPALICVGACTTEVTEPTALTQVSSGYAAERGRRPGHAAGELQIAWKGGPRAPTGAQGPQERWVGVEFTANEAGQGRPTRGAFQYRVASLTGAHQRVITAVIEDVHIDGDAGKVWFIGRVTADSKGCSGGPDGGHGGGCGGDDEGDDGHGGGCGDEDGDDGHDGGCGGGGQGGGGQGGGGHGGGCGDDHGGDDDDGGGCGGDDDGGGCGGGDDDDGGGCGGGDDGDHGGAGGPRGASGRTCRVGQMIVGKAHDGGAPGAPRDGITWKWFLADDPELPAIDDLAAWPHLCRKTITGGDLVVHVPGRGRGRGKP